MKQDKMEKKEQNLQKTEHNKEKNKKQRHIMELEKNNLENILKWLQTKKV